MAQRTCFCKDYRLLGVSLILLCIWWVKILRGVNRRFQAKRSKYKNFNIAVISVPITTKFCTSIKAIMSGLNSRHTNPKRPTAPSSKNQKLQYSIATIWLIFTKFGTVMRLGSEPDRPLKIRTFKIQNGEWRHLENRRNRDISKTARPILTRNGWNDVFSQPLASFGSLSVSLNCWPFSGSKSPKPQFCGRE